MTEVETNGHERREDDPRCVKCGKAWPCEGWLLEPPRLQPAPIPASPARDARVDVYRDRERRRAARALDRYIEAMFLSPADVPQHLGMGESRVAADRFVEAVGDYVLARLGDSALNVQQKSHYDVAAAGGGNARTNSGNQAGGLAPGAAPEVFQTSGHLKKFGATPSDEETHALDHWNRGVVRPGCRYCEAQAPRP